MNRKGKVVVIGLDGGSWDIMNPLIKKGIMPNLKAMIKNGTSGTLKTVFPPSTVPAWYSIATGKNPGNLGVFQFYYLEEGTNLLRLANYLDITRDNNVCDILPTILWIYGIPAPSDIDGRVLSEIFIEEELKKSSKVVDPKKRHEEMDRDLGEMKYYSEEEEEDIKRKLTDLGYI